MVVSTEISDGILVQLAPLPLIRVEYQKPKTVNRLQEKQSQKKLSVEDTFIQNSGA